MSDKREFTISVKQTDGEWCAEALGQRGVATNPLMAVCVWMKNARTAGEALLVSANPKMPTTKSVRVEQPNLTIASPNKLTNN